MLFSHCNLFRKYVCRFRSIFTLILFLRVFFPAAAETIAETRTFNVPALQDEHYVAQPFSMVDQPVSDSIRRLETKIIALAAKVEEQNNLITNLDPNYQVKYPLGIVKTVGGLTYVIVLESDEITPQGAFINAYMHFITPQGKSLCFAANNIPLSASGGINGTVELDLIKNEIIELGNINFIVYGQMAGGTGRSSVHFDCNGFIDMVVDAGVEFSKNMFVRENPETGEQLPNESLTANFVTAIQSWSDLIVDISLPPFQLKSMKGFGLEVNQASFDFSDLNNPAGMKFPDKYPGLITYGDFPQLW